MSSTRELERLYDDHSQALFAFLLNFTRQRDETREVMQDLFIKLARQPDLLCGARSERSFLIRTAHNLAIDRMRRRRTRDTHEEIVGDTESITAFAATSDPDEKAFRHAVSVALGELPPDQRAVVHLKLWEGLTFEEIAAAMDIPPNTAASRYRYGIDKMRTHLRPLYEEIR